MHVPERGNKNILFLRVKMEPTTVKLTVRYSTAATASTCYLIEKLCFCCFFFCLPSQMRKMLQNKQLNVELYDYFNQLLINYTIVFILGRGLLSVCHWCMLNKY